MLENLKSFGPKGLTALFVLAICLTGIVSIYTYVIRPIAKDFFERWDLYGIGDAIHWLTHPGSSWNA